MLENWGEIAGATEFSFSLHRRLRDEAASIVAREEGEGKWSR